MLNLSEQELKRRQKREELIALSIDPYPADGFDVNVTTADIHKNYTKAKIDYKNVSIAGRVMSIRLMGSAAFFELQDEHGRIQVYIRRDDVCPNEDKTLYNVVFKKLLDIGDIVGVKGFVFTTQTGEISIHATSFKILTKSLKPLPIVKREKDEQGNIIVYDAITDPEFRYRQRYVDLIVNPETKEIFRKRTALVNVIRNFFNERGYLEVETPILQPIYGGASARPFKTYHNALDIPLYLRIANELYLKRLIVGGFDGVYEFAKDFRNEGMSRFHNPEFTQVELYVAYKDYFWMMELVEELIEKIAIELYGTAEVKVGEHVINFHRPWKRYTMFEAIEHFTGVNISGMDEHELRNVCNQLNIKYDHTMGKGKLIDELFSSKCEPYLIQPTFIYDYPIEMSPLAKKHRSKEGLVERFEVICNGKEICNAFSELNDPIDQRKRFEEQIELGKRGDEEAMVLDEDFLRALEYGMPPTAGLGIGIDRLTMIMTNQHSIQDVLFFPQMKPERKNHIDMDIFLKIGVPSEYLPLLMKLGIQNPEQLKSINPNKLFNDICSLRKKLKLEIPLPTLDMIKQWVDY